MIVFQIALLAFGVLGGLLVAFQLRRSQWDHASRSRGVVAFGAGAAAWLFFAAVSLPAPFYWVFIGTVLAMYIPSLIVIVASGTGQAKVDQDA